MNKFVEKLVEKMWMLNVKKCEMWNNLKRFLNILVQKWNYARVFQNKFNTFYTNNLCNFNLLNISFPPFPHRTTNTTTLLIINKENNF